MRAIARRRVVDCLLIAILLVGAVQAGRPLLEDLRTASQAQHVISAMTGTVDRTNDVSRLDQLAQAQAYNTTLGGEDAHPHNEGFGGNNGGNADVCIPELSEGTEALPYEEQLTWDEGALCWIEVPRIGIAQPVYRGTSDEVLAAGVGHLAWTSLPVGGVSSHCVLAAHSGMEESSMFDRLGELQRGDIFVVHTLGDAYCYKVRDMQTVLPEDAETLCQVVEDEDLCTLLTCTPYGINSHRLLVTGSRCAYKAEQVQQAAASRRHSVTRRSLPFLACSAGSVGFLVLEGSSWLVARRRKDSPQSAYHRRPGRR